MKRLIPSLFILFFLVQSASALFSDVSSLNKNSVAIDALVEQGVLQGYSDGSFMPDQEVTRAEAVKIILLGMGISVDENASSAGQFSDVTESDWFYDVVGTALNLGIVQGYDDGTFRPSQTVNRAEAVKMMLAADGSTATVPGSDPFVDVPTTAWFSSYANYAKTWNIEPPQTDGLWHPEAAITRGNISEMVYRMQEVENSGNAYDESVTWLDHPFAAVSASFKVPFGWYYKTDGVAAIWLVDNNNSQISLLNPYDNGGTLLITRYLNSNGDSSGELFNSIRGQESTSSFETSINGYNTLVVENGDVYQRQWYVVMPNLSVVHIAALRGDGPYAWVLDDQFSKIVESITYNPEAGPDLDINEILQSLNSAVQVDGQGNAMMDLLDDWELIETDAIGVGTGPVDYFYSPSANITLKYERSFDVILDLRDGQTTAF